MSPLVKNDLLSKKQTKRLWFCRFRVLHLFIQDTIVPLCTSTLLNQSHLYTCLCIINSAGIFCWLSYTIILLQQKCFRALFIILLIYLRYLALHKLSDQHLNQGMWLSMAIWHYPASLLGFHSTVWELGICMGWCAYGWAWLLWVYSEDIPSVSSSVNIVRVYSVLRIQIPAFSFLFCRLIWFHGIVVTLRSDTWISVSQIDIGWHAQWWSYKSYMLCLQSFRMH